MNHPFKRGRTPTGMLLILLAGMIALTGCVSMDTIIPSTPSAVGVPPPAPQPILTSGHNAPQAAPRQPFDAEQTVVSLTFDDGNASQYDAVEALNALKMRGTFYVNSSVLGTPSYLTREQLDSMVENKHEIAGHGLQHRNLKYLAPDEVQRQICWDRQNLLDWGYQITNFAFPEAGANSMVEATVKDCGYNSARGLGGTKSIIGCEACPVAEDLVPKSPFHTLAPAMVDADWKLQDLQNLVTDAEESGGGWMQITFHHLCPATCNELSVDIAVFKEFAEWLKARERSHGTVVRTVDDVIGGEVRPAVAPKMPEAREKGNLVINSDMEKVGITEDIRCWEPGGFGENTALHSDVNEGIGRSVGLRLDMEKFRDGDAKMLQRLDAGECAPQVRPGLRYELKAQYTSDAPTQFVMYLRSEHGEWLYWTASEWLKKSSEFTEARWITPEIPEGFSGLSVGLSLFSEGTLVVDEVDVQKYPQD